MYVHESSIILHYTTLIPVYVRFLLDSALEIFVRICFENETHNGCCNYDGQKQHLRRCIRKHMLEFLKLCKKKLFILHFSLKKKVPRMPEFH